MESLMGKLTEKMEDMMKRSSEEVGKEMQVVNGKVERMESRLAMADLPLSP